MPAPLALVVDNEPGIRSYIATVLHMVKYQTLEAESAAKGLAIAQRLGSAVDLIVSDVEMPGGDGTIMVEAVREFLPQVPVILVSGHARPETTCDAFLLKPFLPSALLSAVERVINSRVAQAENPIRHRENESRR